MNQRRVLFRARTALSRLPGRHGFGLIPWIVPLLFGLAGAPVSTEGPDEAGWILAISIANVAAWVAQGIVLLIIRRRALRLPPTPRGGLVAIALFALIGAIGGVVQAAVLSRTELADPPQFIAPSTLVLFSILTWVCTASIVAFAFSWRDQLADSLRASELHAARTRDALARSTALEAQRRAVVARLLRQRTIPALAEIDAAVRATSGTAAAQQAADAIERLARDDIRSASHLLHPVTAAHSLPSALALASRLCGLPGTGSGIEAEVPISPDVGDRVTLTVVDLLLDDEPARPCPPLQAALSADHRTVSITLDPERTVRIPLEADADTAVAFTPTPRWHQIAPAPFGMPWVAIALLNAFSVLAATLAAGSGLWLAAFADMAVITVGTAALDRLLRTHAIQRLSARRQWLLIAVIVAAIGAAAGAVWGTMIDGETASLTVLGLVCALSMGLFLPGIRVWASAVRRLRADVVLADLAVGASAARQRVRDLESSTAAAEALHATVQSQLLGVAGAIGSDTPDDLRVMALGKLDDVVRTALPAIATQLETIRPEEEIALLDAPALSSLWPEVAITMQVPNNLPQSALKLINSVVVEAVGNAVQHGHADAVDVQATLWPGALEITVEDDGIGVDTSATDGLGLSAIRSIASEFSLRPGPAGGTRLDLRLPYFA